MLSSLVFWIYLIGILDRIHALFILGTLAFAGLGAFSFISTREEFSCLDADEKPKYLKAAKWCGIVAGMLMILETLTPSTDTAYAMLGLSIGQEIVDNPPAMVAKSLKALDLKLDEIIEESEDK